MSILSWTNPLKSEGFYDRFDQPRPYLIISYMQYSKNDFLLLIDIIFSNCTLTYQKSHWWSVLNDTLQKWFVVFSQTTGNVNVYKYGLVFLCCIVYFLGWCKYKTYHKFCIYKYTNQIHNMIFEMNSCSR